MAPSAAFTMCPSEVIDHRSVNMGTGQEGKRVAFERAYRVGKVLGKGGFGTVYAGVRVRDSRLVAIKHVARGKVTEWDEVRPSTICLTTKQK